MLSILGISSWVQFGFGLPICRGGTGYSLAILYLYYMIDWIESRLKKTDFLAFYIQYQTKDIPCFDVDVKRSSIMLGKHSSLKIFTNTDFCTGSPNRDSLIPHI